MGAARKLRDDYYDGNAVRKITAVPERDWRREEQRRENERRQREISRNRNRRRQKAAGLDLKSLLFYMVALCVTIYMAVGYLQAQALMRANEKGLVAVQKEILAIQDENSAIKNSAPTISLSEVYRIATEELGMVHPQNNQKIGYESSKPDYLKQYGEVPTGEKSNILSDILK